MPHPATPAARWYLWGQICLGPARSLCIPAFSTLPPPCRCHCLPTCYTLVGHHGFLNGIFKLFRGGGPPGWYIQGRGFSFRVGCLILLNLFMLVCAPWDRVPSILIIFFQLLLCDFLFAGVCCVCVSFHDHQYSRLVGITTFTGLGFLNYMYVTD